MAYGYDADGSSVAAATLAGNNNFTGIQTFVGNVDATSTTNGTVVIQGGMGVQGKVFASQVWGAYWNDLVDCIEVPENTELDFGYAYCFDGKNYYKARKYLDDGFIGIHSDTAGFYMGKKSHLKQMQVAVAGFVLVHIDQIYPTGTPLTITEGGVVTQMQPEDLKLYPHKMIGTFWKEEKEDKWGPEDHKINVNGRHWIKII